MSLISGAAVVAGVVGHPIAHSLSPLLHGAWIAAAGLDAAYVPLSCPADGFRALIEGLRHSVRGLNVTAPFKGEAFALADKHDQAAARAGSANLLLFNTGGNVEARSTDGAGLLAAIAEQAPGLSRDSGPAMVFGAGGAARAAAAALLDEGWAVWVAARSPGAARTLAGAVAGAEALDWRDLDQALPSTVLLVNATSAPATSDLGLPWPVVPPHATALDMTYRPLRTTFLQAAEARGCTTVDGLAMLIGQARPSFEALFGRPPPSVDVRALALARL